MKKYPETFHDKFKNFIKLNTKKKLKWTLKLLGIKHIIYNILYFFLSRIIKSKNYNDILLKAYLILYKSNIISGKIFFNSDSSISFGINITLHTSPFGTINPA